MPNTPTILIAEDNAMDALLVQQALKMAGFNNPTHVVTDGEKAVHYLEGQGVYANRREFPLPGMLFLDLGLPHRSGFEVLRWISSQSYLPRFEVVILSGSKTPEDLELAQRLGAREFIAKPDTLDELVAHIRTLEEYLVPGHLHFPSIVQRAIKPHATSHHGKASRYGKHKAKVLAE